MCATEAHPHAHSMHMPRTHAHARRPFRITATGDVAVWLGSCLLARSSHAALDEVPIPKSTHMYPYSTHAVSCSTRAVPVQYACSTRTVPVQYPCSSSTIRLGSTMCPPCCVFASTLPPPAFASAGAASSSCSVPHAVRPLGTVRECRLVGACGLQPAD
jgi:hypothetical protein